MSGQRYAPEFKDEAVRQVVELGHSVAEVAEKLFTSQVKIKIVAQKAPLISV